MISFIQRPITITTLRNSKNRNDNNNKDLVIFNIV